MTIRDILLPLLSYPAATTTGQRREGGGGGQQAWRSYRRRHIRVANSLAVGLYAHPAHIGGMFAG